MKTNFHAIDLDEVRLIRDKRTGISRQFAFAQFKDIPTAKAFLEKHHPSIQFQGSYGEANSTEDRPYVRLAYSREKDERERPGKAEGDWICEVCSLGNFAHRVVCFRCHAPRTRSTATGVVTSMVPGDMSAFSGFPKTGDSDVSPHNQPSQFLLFRSLEAGVTEELLAKAVTKLYRQGSTPPTGISQSANKPKITSTSSTTLLGAKEGSLKRVLLVRDRATNDSWRYGFAEFASVDDASAALAKYNATDKFTISSKPVMVSYIHTGVFVPAPHTLSSDLERFTFSPLSNPSVKLIYWDQAAYTHELMVAKSGPSDLDKIKQRVQEAALRANKAAGEGLLGAPKEGVEKKRKAEKEVPTSNKKVVAPHLQFWSNRHAEIHGLPAAQKAPEGVFHDAKDAAPSSAAAADDEPPSRSFADMNRKCCLLCARQFKTDAEVHKHERISQLHRDNMLKDDLVEKALAKMAKAGIVPESDSAYRDRAKERRQAFNQPKQPSGPGNAKRKKASPPPEEPLKPAQSKGAALLGKMGWTAGQGLGADGSGRTEAISTELYAQGVGLGAVGGKVGDAVEEANRNTGGSYKDFVAMARDKAKERFERMG